MGEQREQQKSSKTCAHETLEGAGLPARLVPFETLELVVAPKMEQVEAEKLAGG